MRRLVRVFTGLSTVRPVLAWRVRTIDTLEAQLWTSPQLSPASGADASVIALAERHNATAIATLDRRHFSVVRPSHVAVFAIVP